MSLPWSFFPHRLQELRKFDVGYDGSDSNKGCGAVLLNTPRLLVLVLVVLE